MVIIWSQDVTEVVSLCKHGIKMGVPAHCSCVPRCGLLKEQTVHSEDNSYPYGTVRSGLHSRLSVEQ